MTPLCCYYFFRWSSVFPLFSGGKVRVLPLSCATPVSSERVDMELRGVPLEVLERFHAEVSGETTWEKFHSMAIAGKHVTSKERRSWVETDQEGGERCGPADVVLVYRWDLPWGVIMRYLKRAISHRPQVH